MANGGVISVKFSGNAGPSDNIYISGLPSPSVDMAALTEIFSGSGFTIKRSKAIADTRGMGSSAAQVQFGSEEEATAAMESLQGHTCEECGLFASQEPVMAPAAYAAPGGKGKGNGKGKVNTPPVARPVTAMPVRQPMMAMAPRPQFAAPRVGPGAPLMVKFSGRDNTPCDNLYLAGLPGVGVTQDVLKELVACLGCSVVRMKTVRDTKGIGSSAANVQVGSVEQAESCIEALNGQSWAAIAETNQTYQSNMQCLEILPAGLWVKYVGQSGIPINNIYISGLPSPQVEESELHGIFYALGLTLLRAKIVPDSKGIGTSAAMVELATSEEAAFAILKLNSRGPAIPVAVALAQAAAAAPQPMGFAPQPMGQPMGYAPQGKGMAPRPMAVAIPSPRSFASPYGGKGGKGAPRQMAVPQGMMTMRASPYAMAGAGKAPRAPAPAPMPQAAPGTLVVKYSGKGGQPSDNLYIAGLPSPQVQEQDLRNMLQEMGVTMGRTKIVSDTRGTGSSAAMVQLGSADEAAYAIGMLNGAQSPFQQGGGYGWTSNGGDGGGDYGGDGGGGYGQAQGW